VGGAAQHSFVAPNVLAAGERASVFPTPESNTVALGPNTHNPSTFNGVGAFTTLPTGNFSTLHHPTYSMRELNNLFTMNPDTWFIKESTYRDLNHHTAQEDDMNNFTDMLNENMTDDDSEFLPITSLINNTAWPPSSAPQHQQHNTSAFGSAYESTPFDTTTVTSSGINGGAVGATEHSSQMHHLQYMQMQQQWMQQLQQQNTQFFNNTTSASAATDATTNVHTSDTTPSNPPSTITDLHSVDIGEEVRNIVKQCNEVGQMAAGRSCSGYLLHGVPNALRTELITLKSQNKYQEGFESPAGEDHEHVFPSAGDSTQGAIDRTNDHEFIALQKEVARLRKRDLRRQNEIQILSAMNESLRLQLMNMLSRRTYRMEDDTTEIRLPKAEGRTAESKAATSSEANMEIPVGGDDFSTSPPPQSNASGDEQQESHLSRPDASNIDSLSKSFTELLSLFNSKEQMDSHSMGILVCFPGGRITTCNKTLLERIGYDASALYDELSRWEDVISERFWGNVIRFLAQTLKTVSHKRAFHLEECGVKHRNGTVIPCEIIVTIIGGNFSQIPVFVCSYFRFKEGSEALPKRYQTPSEVNFSDILPLPDA